MKDNGAVHFFGTKLYVWWYRHSFHLFFGKPPNLSSISHNLDCLAREWTLKRRFEILVECGKTSVGPRGRVMMYCDDWDNVGVVQRLLCGLDDGWWWCALIGWLNLVDLNGLVGVIFWTKLFLLSSFSSYFPSAYSIILTLLLLLLFPLLPINLIHKTQLITH